MGIFSGSEEMNNTCRKRINTVTMDRGFTILVTQGYSLWDCIPCHNNHKLYILLTWCISSLQLVVRINSNYVLTSCKKKLYFLKGRNKVPKYNIIIIIISSSSSSSSTSSSAALGGPWPPHLNTITIIILWVKYVLNYQVSSILQEEVCHISVTILTGICQSSISSLRLGMDVCRSFKQIPENKNRIYSSRITNPIT